MDLREKVSLVQRVSEYSIRFRLPEVLLMAVLSVVALFSIDGVLVSAVPLSEQVESTVIAFTQQDFSAITANLWIIIAALLLFVFRGMFFGFKCGLLWFFFLLFNPLLLLAFGEYKDVMQILLACTFIISITGFFFIRSLLVKTILPLILLAYSLSAWLLFLGISNLAWFGLVSVFFADTFHLIFVISYQVRSDAKNKKTLSGAIVHGVRRTIPVSLLTIALLIIMDTVFHFTGQPMLASKSLLHSVIIYICYVLWMPFFTAALFSFCPLENTCEKMKKISK
ncbi:MAG: hypothetical protein LBU89_09470 [Fibromonadaceae bacterium]|jgi:hypothetical protein|nr:hypothetical protein [Fibromonadaceae bacterium]